MVQLTKLRLAGFKSFVDPTEVLIEPGLTGIVGPNGCGKSNLVEALRWVMGENSAKRMRGGEMDDVIFAGSANRPSRNIAEVGLILDNAARRAPAQFNDSEELEVTRRIERNSGSTFRVNRREVRARDVQLLFADAATGAHSTALVSQGRVGALINAKPTARRALLEEAAGITGLHSRRHEAELRLRAAETNLERLEDVISTLEGQFQGLKRQARQASRYRNLAGHIRRNEAVLLHLEAESAKQGLAQAQQSHSDCEAVVADLTREAAGRAAEQGEAASVLPDLRQAEAEAAAALQRFLVDRENLDREDAAVATARERAEARREQIERDRSHAQSLADDANEAQTRLDQERRTLEAEAEGEATAQADATEGRDAAAAVVAEREAEADRVAEGVATCEAQKAALGRRHGELADRLARLRNEADARSAERDRLVEQQISATLLDSATAELTEAEQRLAATRERADVAESQLTDCRAAENVAREALQKAESDCGRVEAEIAALTAMLEPAESDIWPPIVDTISVDPGYEAALGAALGDDLIASTDEGAPVHWETLPRYQDTPDLPAGAQRLSDIVRGPQALDRRLAQIGVVTDMAAGERLQHALKTGQRLVSMDGGLWRWDGFTVRAGSQTTAARRLEQRNRLKELRPALERQQATVEAKRAASAAAQAAMEDTAKAEREAREALRTAFAAVDSARDARASLAQKATESSSRLTAVRDTIERLEAELGEATAAQERVRDDQAALPDLDAERARLTDLRSQLSEARGALSESQSALDRLLREAEVRAQRLAAIEQEKASWARRATEADRYITELAERRAEVDGEIEALAARPEELAVKRDSLAEIIAEAESRRRAAADALAMGETRQADADRALKEQEQKLAEARENRVRAEAAVTQSRMTLDQIAEKVRERLECDIDAVLNEAEVDPGQDLPARDEVETKLARLIRERDNMGPVNLRADQEAQELEQQIGSMQSERGDLLSAIARLRQGIASLNREGRERLLAAFETVNGHFSELFTRLFGGGRAHLALTEAEDPLEAGLEIMASPPGKRLQVMSLLSGGEQALTALSLLFAVFLTNPAPICVLDEVDAPLDDANVDRFCNLVEELARHTATRFLIITHHRMTMARVDRLFGVTMAERGVSQLVSVDLQAADELRESA